MKYILTDNERFYIDSGVTSYDVIELLSRGGTGSENVVMGKLVVGSGMIATVNFYKFLGTYSKKGTDSVETPDFSSTAETPDVNKTYVDILTLKAYWYDANPSIMPRNRFRELSVVDLSNYYTKTEVDSEVSGKTSFVYYQSESEREAATGITGGTLATDAETEEYFVYDQINGEWLRIDWEPNSYMFKTVDGTSVYGNGSIKTTEIVEIVATGNTYSASTTNANMNAMISAGKTVVLKYFNGSIEEYYWLDHAEQTDLHFTTVNSNDRLIDTFVIGERDDITRTTISIDDLDKIPYSSTSAVASVTIEPYKMYDFGTLSTAMTISFDTSKEISGYARQYMLRFVAGEGCDITLPNGVYYLNNVEPVFTTGRTYEFDITNMMCVFGEFYHASN